MIAKLLFHQTLPLQFRDKVNRLPDLCVPFIVHCGLRMQELGSQRAYSIVARILVLSAGNVGQPEIDCLHYADEETNYRAKEFNCFQVMLSN